MTVTHIVLFQFKQGVDADQIKHVSSRFFALQHKCINTATQKPYILSIKGGSDNSIEGRQNGMTHAFVLEFASEEDRNYYVEKDSAHHDFVKLALEKLENASIVDFTPGVFM